MWAQEVEAIARGKGELTNAELYALDGILNHFLKEVKEYDRVFLEGKAQEAEAQIKIGVKETRQISAVKDTWWRRVKNSMEAPVWRFERLGGYRKNSLMARLFRELQAGVDKRASFKMEAAQHFEKFMKENRKEIDTWREPTHEVNGVTLSKGQMISLYLTSLRNQAQTHLFDEEGTRPYSFERRKVCRKKNQSRDAYKQRARMLKSTKKPLNRKKLNATDKQFIDLVTKFFQWKV